MNFQNNTHQKFPLSRGWQPKGATGVTFFATNFNKYFGYFLISWKRLQLYKLDLILDILNIIVRLVLPYSVFWILVQNGHLSLDLANGLVWAIFIGQIINKASFSSSAGPKKIRDEIRTGEIVTQLSLPLNYILARSVDHIGTFLFKFTVYFVILAPFLALLVPSNVNLLLILPFSFFSSLLILGFNLCLGLSSFIIEENEGMYYILSKMFYLFGNQAIPVALMPNWVTNWVVFTPFYLGLAAPAEIARGTFDPKIAIVMYLIYFFIFVVLVSWLFKKLQTQVLVNGG